MQYTDIKGVLFDVHFKCANCECRRFQRPNYFSENLTFFEGHFECMNCFQEFGYYDDTFTLLQAQLTLFE